MNRHVKFSSDEVAPLRGYYQGITHDVFRTLWRRKGLIIGFAIVGLAIAAAAIVVLPPRYTSEALLQVNFSRDEPNTATKIQRIASMEAGAVVESALRILKSRALAADVVSRLGLADDAEFVGLPSRLMRVTWSIRKMFGLSDRMPTAHDLAVDRLVGALQVNIVPRSYVISVAINAGDPQRAAQLTNAVVLEYLRGQQVQHLADLQRILERDIADMSAIYGASHPRSVGAKERFQELQRRIVELRRADTLDASSIDSGEFLAAKVVLLPSGPNLPIVFALVMSLSLLVCAGLIAILEYTSHAPHWDRFATVVTDGDDTAQVVTVVHGGAQDSPAARRLA